jgi:hypothetical protein
MVINFLQMSLVSVWRIICVRVSLPSAGADKRIVHAIMARNLERWAGKLVVDFRFGVVYYG